MQYFPPSVTLHTRILSLLLIARASPLSHPFFFVRAIFFQVSDKMRANSAHKLLVRAQDFVHAAPDISESRFTADRYDCEICIFIMYYDTIHLMYVELCR